MAADAVTPTGNYRPPRELVESLDALAGQDWSLEPTDAASKSIAVRSGEALSWLDVKHDGFPASAADMEFVAGILSDVRALIESIHSGHPIDGSTAAAIAARHSKTTAGTWAVHLEAEGGLGGCNVITMGASSRDLYLHFDGQLAPDAMWLVVGLAHTEMSAMLKAVRQLGAAR